MSVRLRTIGKNIQIDDTISDRVDGQISEKLSEYLASLDAAQDKDDSTYFRPENVLSEITSLNPAPADGWHLYLGTGVEENNLVLVAGGAISDRYTPKVGDTIRIGTQQKEFDGEWKNFELAAVDAVNRTLTNLLADTWTQIPTSGFTKDLDFQIFDVNNVTITRSLVVRRAGNSFEINSLTALSNLNFEIRGVF